MPPTSEEIAVCPNCESPLIATMLFSYAEWYCLDCGGKYGWFEEKRVKSTALLAAKLARYRLEWEEWAPKLLTGGVMHRDCSECKKTGEPHARHATDEEKAASQDALAALKARMVVV